MTKTAALTAVIALSVIHRTIVAGKAGNRLAGVAPVAPKIQEISPNTVFTPKDETELNELLAAGAVRYPTKNDDPKHFTRLNELFPVADDADQTDIEAEEMKRARDKIAQAQTARREQARIDAEARAAREAEEAEELRLAEEKRLQDEADKAAAAQAAGLNGGDQSASENDPGPAGDQQGEAETGKVRDTKPTTKPKASASKAKAKADDDDDKSVV